MITGGKLLPMAIIILKADTTVGEPIILSKHCVQLTFMSTDCLPWKSSISIRNIESNTGGVQDREIPRVSEFSLSYTFSGV